MPVKLQSIYNRFPFLCCMAKHNLLQGFNVSVIIDRSGRNKFKMHSSPYTHDDPEVTYSSMVVFMPFGADFLMLYWMIGAIVLPGITYKDGR